MQGEPNIEVRRIKKPDQLIQHWSFFVEGLERVNRLLPEDQRIEPLALFRVCLQALQLGEDRGHIAIYYYDRAPSGYTITLEVEPLCSTRRTALIFLAYARKTIPGGARKAMQHVEQWARKSGFQELQAFSARINGSGFALFERRFGFKRLYVCFYKQIG